MARCPLCVPMSGCTRGGSMRRCHDCSTRSMLPPEASHLSTWTLIYESTAVVLEALGSCCAFRMGTVLSIDELFGTAEVLAHEYRALNEAAAKWQFKYEFVSSIAITRKSA